MLNFQRPYRHWIIGLGNSGQEIISEMAANPRLLGSEVQLAVVKIGDIFQSPPDGVEQANFTVLKSTETHRTAAREALLRDMKDNRPRLIKRLRDMLIADHQNIVWLVGSLHEAQVTGMIFDLAHIMRRLGDTPGHQMTHIFWVLSAAGGANNAQAAAVLQEIHRLTQHGESWKRFYPYHSGEDDGSLMPHTEEKPDEDITDLFLCSTPPGALAVLGDNNLKQRIALALLELTRTTTFTTCSKIWASHITVRRQHMAINNQLYVSTLGAFVMGLPTEILREQAAIQTSKEILIGRTIKDARAGLFDLAEATCAQQPESFLIQRTTHPYLQAVGQAMRKNGNPPMLSDAGAEEDVVNSTVSLFNEECQAFAGHATKLGRCREFTKRLGTSWRAKNPKPWAKPFIEGTLEQFEKLQDLRSKLPGEASRAKSECDQKLQEFQVSLFDGGYWNAEEILAQSGVETWLPQSRIEEIMSDFSFHWVKNEDRLALIVKIGSVLLPCTVEYRKAIWKTTMEKVKAYYHDWNIALDQVEVEADHKTTEIHYQIEQGSLMLNYKFTDGVIRRTFLLGGTTKWKQRWSDILNAGSENDIDGSADRGIVLQIHTFIPLLSAKVTQKMWEEYLNKPDQIEAYHLFESEKVSAGLKVKAQKYADMVNHELLQIRDKRLSQRAVALFEGNDTATSCRQVEAAEWLAQAWLRGQLKQRQGKGYFRLGSFALADKHPFHALQAWLMLDDAQRIEKQESLVLDKFPILNDKVDQARLWLLGSEEDVDWSILVFATLCN